MLTRWRSTLCLAVVGLSGGALAAPASANFVVSGADAVGDTAGGHPGRDITRVALQYNRRTGALKGGIQLAGDPVPAPGNLTLFAGSSTAGGCNGYPAVGFGTQTDLTSANWVRLTQAGETEPLAGSAVKSYEGAAEDYETFDNRSLRGLRPDCVIARLDEPGNQANLFDVAGPFPLRGLAELTATFTRERYLTRGKPYRFEVAVRNVGDGPSGRLRLKTVRVKGLQVRMPRTLPSIAVGKRRTVSIRATAGRRAPSSFDFQFSATGGEGITTSAEEFTPVVDRQKPTPGGGGGGGSDDGPKLCYSYTWLPPYSELRPC